MLLSLNSRRFRSVANTENGDVDGSTVFHYHQDGRAVWATYAGGAISSGTLTAIMLDNGDLDMRYHHVTTAGELRGGRCHSRPTTLSDGRIRLVESWTWTEGASGAGESVVEETLETVDPEIPHMSGTSRDLWSRTVVRVWPEDLSLASFAAGDESWKTLPATPFWAVIIEGDEVSVTATPDELAGLPVRSAAGPYKALTLDLPIDLGVCGYLLPAAAMLAQAGVSIVPQCGYLKDHLLVRASDLELAVGTLERLIREAGRSTAQPASAARPL